MHTCTCPTNNDFSSSEWLSTRNWSHIVSFTLVNWAVCPLHAVLPFLFPSFPITLLLFSTPLIAGGNALLSNFQLNWQHCTISFPSQFQKPLPGLGRSLSFFLFPISVPFLTPPHLPSSSCLGTVPEAQTEPQPKWRKSTISHQSPSSVHTAFGLVPLSLAFPLIPGIPKHLLSLQKPPENTVAVLPH